MLIYWGINVIINLVLRLWIFTYLINNVTISIINISINQLAIL